MLDLPDSDWMTAHVCSFPAVAEKFQVILFSKYEEVLGNDHLSFKLGWRIRALSLWRRHRRHHQVEMANFFLLLHLRDGTANEEAKGEKKRHTQTKKKGKTTESTVSQKRCRWRQKLLAFLA